MLRFAFIFFIIAIALMGDARALSGPNTPKSFIQWKSEKLNSARDHVKTSRQKLEALKIKGVRKSDPQYRFQLLQLNQSEWNLEVAQELSLVDYVVLYLANPENKLDLRQAASKLTPDQTERLLEAYIRAVQINQRSQRGPELPRNSRDN